jgi:hypothetical protein
VPALRIDIVDVEVGEDGHDEPSVLGVFANAVDDHEARLAVTFLGLFIALVLLVVWVLA